MENLTKGNDPNVLKLIVEEAKIQGYVKMNNGIMEGGVIITLSKYNASDVLSQMLDDYGYEEIIKMLDELNN